MSGGTVLARQIPPQSGPLLPSPAAGPSTAPLLAPRPVKPPRLDSLARSQANAVASSSKSPVPSRPPSRTERRFKCSFDGCDKAYTKPSRLAEHELTHTGERPHACPHCSQTYLRASHLTAHLRTHLPKDAKQFTCTRDGCDKTFWTATHLKRHEQMHDETPSYTCDRCDAAFNKSHLLRDHVVLAHMPAGTKPYPCGHPDCDWSFALKHQLRAHEKTHDPTRYTCSHPAHDDAFPAFPTWSALQAHLHTAHPPTCPHVECNGRTFKSTQRLREHLQVHEDREADIRSRKEHSPDDMQEGEGDPLPGLLLEGVSKRKKRRRSSIWEEAEGAKSPKLRRLLDGEAGKEWACGDEGCEKRFKTKFALETHTRTSHLQMKIHTCPRDGCGKSYSHLSNLQRHVESHSRPSTPTTPRKGDGRSAGALLAGHGEEARRFGCPVHSLHTSAEDRSAVDRQSASDREELERDEHLMEDRCTARFWRVYDVRRHLKGEHGIDLGDMEVRRLLVKAGASD